MIGKLRALVFCALRGRTFLSRLPAHGISRTEARMYRDQGMPAPKFVFSSGRSEVAHVKPDVLRRLRWSRVASVRMKPRYQKTLIKRAFDFCEGGGDGAVM